MTASFNCWGTPPVTQPLTRTRHPTVDKDVVKALGELGVVDFRSSAGRPSCPTASQFDMPLSAFVISSMDGSFPSDRLSGRGGKEVDDRGIEFQRFLIVDGRGGC